MGEEHPDSYPPRAGGRGAPSRLFLHTERGVEMTVALIQTGNAPFCATVASMGANQCPVAAKLIITVK